MIKNILKPTVSPQAKEMFENCKKSLAFTTATFGYKSGILPSGTKFMIFDYYMSNYTTWMNNPWAMDCRGIMFEVDDTDIEKANVIRIMSRPMSKFFNWGENPMTIVDINYDDIDRVYIKADGSIISTYIDKGNLCVKSRFSEKSDQVELATKFLNNGLPLWVRIKHILTKLAKAGFTVDMEYVSKQNCIVVVYDQPFLFVHSIRHNDTGKSYFVDQLEGIISKSEMDDLKRIESPQASDEVFKDMFSEEWEIDTRGKIKHFMESQKGYEGVVVHLKNGLTMKVKTEWYCTLHNVCWTLNSDKNLLLSIINQTSDDLRFLHADNEFSIDRIGKFEDYYQQYIKRQLRCIKYAVEVLRFWFNGQYDSSNREIRASVVKCLNGLIEYNQIEKLTFSTIMSNYDYFVGVAENFLENGVPLDVEYIIKQFINPYMAKNVDTLSKNIT